MEAQANTSVVGVNSTYVHLHVSHNSLKMRLSTENLALSDEFWTINSLYNLIRFNSSCESVTVTKGFNILIMMKASSKVISYSIELKVMTDGLCVNLRPLERCEQFGV